MAPRPRLTDLLSALIRKAQRYQRSKQTRASFIEKLEDRHLLAVASPPNQTLTIADDPIAITSGLIDNDPNSDMVALSRTGQLSVALNARDGSWRSVSTIDLGLNAALGSVLGMTGSSLNGDAYLDLVVIGPTSARVLYGNGNGSFRMGPATNAPLGASFRMSSSEPAVGTVALLNDDLLPDIALLLPAQNQVVIHYGLGGERFADPVTFTTGGLDPTALDVGDVIGDDRDELVIGHRSGTLSFLTRTPVAGGLDTWSVDVAASRTGSTPIRSLAIGDVDRDGDDDIAVSAGTSAFILYRDADLLDQPPLTNGSFAQGLTGWTVTSVGSRDGQTAGTVSALGGSAQLIENSSLLTSLTQTFTVPENPQSISLNISAISLEFSGGAIPDAFELSLLGSDQTSVVPTHRPGTTSFFNATGTSNGQPNIRLATGATFASNVVTVDISSLVPGSQVTLAIDLIGNPPGVASTATISDVSITPGALFSRTFTNTPLTGAFTQTGAIELGDVDSDGATDIVLVDSGSRRVVVFNGNLTRPSFEREDIDMSSLGGAPTALALAALDNSPGADIAVAIPNRDLLVSPLRPDNIETGRSLPAIDFERNALGNLLRVGAILDNEFADWGVTVSGPNSATIKPVVLNWSRSIDRSTPGAAALGKVLALAEARDNDHDDHDDDHCTNDLLGNHHDDEDASWRLASGPITFDFQLPVRLDQLGLLGIKTGSSAVVKLFASNGALLQTKSVLGNAAGAEQTVVLNARNVAKLVVELQGKGAISQLIFNRDIAAGSRIQLTGSTQINEGSAYTLSLASPLIAAQQWLINWGDGRIDRLAGDPIAAPHTFADGRSQPIVYATARDAQGNVYLANLWQMDVANVAPVLAISGSSTLQSGSLFRLTLAVNDPGQDQLSHWVIEWGDGSRSSLPGSATSATHTYKLTSSQNKTYTIRANARDEDTQRDNAYRSNDLTVTVTPDTSRVLPTIDFERDGDGSILRAPVRLSDQFETLGIAVSSTATFPRGPMIVDSSRPSAAARDIGSPNSTYHGSGYGLGGMRGTTGANSVAQKNVLILASDVRSTNPDDYEAGGVIRFDFEQPVKLTEVHLLDIDKSGSVIRLYAAIGTLIATQLIPRRGVNSFQVVALNASHVSRMEIDLKGGGAIAAIVSQRGAPTIARPDSRFFVVDGNDLIYRYSAPGSDLGDFSLPVSAQARGIASDLDSNPLWIISEEGTNDRVLVIDSSTERVIGSWLPRGLDKPQGIATDGTDLWIVDSGSRKVVRYAGAATKRSGSASPTSSFVLATNNAQPTDMVTDGTWLWVVDAGSDRVYQYDLQGRLTNSWVLDPANSDPAGIAIQPSQSDGLYVLDSFDRKVNIYAHRTWTSAGPQPVIGSFTLSAGNLLPTGLADPGGQLPIGTQINESLAAGQSTTWTFDASARQSLYINFQLLDSTLSWDLLAPNGTSILSKSDFRASGLDSGTLVIDTTGTYSLVLTAGPSTATYQFQVFDVPGPDIQPITLGQTLAGALNSPGRPDHWTFSGNQGDTYYLNFLSIDTVVGGDLIVEARSPSGQVISTRTATRESSLDQFFTLTESGDWTIVMRAVFDGSHLPSYTFQLTSVPADDVGTISYRQTITGTIQAPGARDRWQFQALADQEIFFDMQSLVGGDTRVQIVNSSGAIVAERTFSLASGLDQQLILRDAGQYTIIVDGAGSANLIEYRFVLWDVPAVVTQATLINSSLSGQTVPGQIVRYVFDAQAGTPVLLDVIESSAQSLGITLIAPDGSTLVDRSAADLLLTLPVTGQYTAVVSRSIPSTFDAFGPYGFRIQDRSSPSIGQLDNLGTRFYVAFPQNLRQPFAPNNPVFSLTITAPVDTSGTVQIPGLGYTTSYVVRAGQATRIELPGTVEIMNSDRIVDQGVLITALDEVAVYGLDRMQESTDGFTALPVDAIGNDYFVLGYSNTISYVIDGGTNLTIAATEDNTAVTITPTVTVGTRLAGQPFTITLNQGQAYTLHTSLPFLADLSGSRVTSTKPISLFGGNTAARVPVDVLAADHLIEQLPPTSAWGSRFATVPLATRTGGDTFRVMARQADTQVRINGTLVATLAAGRFYEAILTASSLIEASAPVLVAQYSNGSAQDGVPSDPFMMLIPPIEQYLSDYTLSTPSDGININYANLIIPSDAVGTLRMDGAPLPVTFTAIGSSGLSGARIPISVGSHRFQATKPFGLAIYGFADFDSYGYFGGMSLGRVAAVDSLTLSPNAVQLPVGTLHTITAIVKDASGSPLSSVRVDFTIEGISRETRSVVTDVDGRASIQLSRTTSGVDRVTALAGGRTQVATVNWQAGTPQITVTSPAPNSQVLVGPRLITGTVTAGGAGASIVEVTINGVRAAALDTSGNFFAPIDVALGSQSFTVAATNSAGLQASTTITLTGIANNVGQLSLTNSADITSSATLRWSSTSYNHSLHQLVADVQVVNVGATPIDASVAARFDSIEPSRVTVVNPDIILAIGTASGTRPAILFDSEIDSSGLATSASSQPIEVRFDLQNQDRFEVDVSLLARTNRPPRFTSVPEPQATVGEAYRTRVEAVDPDGSRLSYALLVAPTGMTIDSVTGELVWNVQASQVGSHQVALQASDGRGGIAKQQFTVVANATIVNRPPLILSTPLTTATPGGNYRYQLNARDPDGQPLQYSLVAGPSGMSVVPTTGLVSFDNAQVGDYPVELRVSDGRGGLATQSYRLSVGTSTASASPRIVSTPPAIATVGTLFVYTVGAVDPQQSTLTYSLTSNPSGMQIDAVSGRITWRPASADIGVQVVRVEVRNTLGGVASQTWSVTVSSAVPNTPPVFTSTASLIATVGTAYVYNSTAVDSDTPLQYALVSAPSGMVINRNTGRVAWTPTVSQLGNQLVVLSATDSLGAKSFQQYQVSVRGTNLAPEFTSTPTTSAAVGTAYRYNAAAVDIEDEVTYSLVTAPSGMLIDVRSGAITYLPLPAQIGSQSITVRATDARGLVASQAYTLVISDDRTPPVVSVNFSRNNILPGESVRIQVAAFDASGISSVNLSIDGQARQLDATRGLTYVATRPGLPVIIASASDIRGNVASAVANPSLRVLDPNDAVAPFIEITSPTPGQVVTYLTDVLGTVTDENLEFYRLEISLAGANQWQPVLTRNFTSTAGTDGVVAGVLGVLDPTLLANDLYELRVVAQDVSGNLSTRVIEWAVEASAKIGNFQFTASQNYCGCGAKFVDLELPLAGIPISITRSYDTLNAPYVGDFGYGWTMAVANPRINESVRISASEAAGGGSLVANPFRTGTRVYLNAPDGRRVGFTFEPIPEGGLLGTVWTPRFIADPGVEMELQVEPTSLSQQADGTFTVYLFGLAYNPDSYTLVTRDQVRYTYNQFADRQLQSITSRNNVQLTFDDTGIHSSTGPEILWERDAAGRITSIIDPAGNRLHYRYDALGDLVEFENQIGDVTRMSYLTDPAHYLQSVIDPHGQEVVLVRYDDDHRVAGIGDALGNSTGQAYDLANNREVIADRMGNETTIEFDDRGNITRVTDSLNHTITTQYDDRDRPTRVTDPRGNVTQIEYDQQSNPTRVIDAAGQAWLATYNQFNDLLTRINPLGEVNRFEYDERGNMTRGVDTNGAVTLAEYDDTGRVTRLTDVRDQVYRFEYAGYSEPTLVVMPDGSQRQSVQDELGRIETFTDENGSQVQFTQDAAGRVQEIIAPDGTRSRMTYDRERLVAATDALGRTTRYEYDEKGRLTAVFAPATTTQTARNPDEASVSNAFGEVRIAAQIYNPNDYIVSRSDALGRTTKFFYDPYGNLLQVQDPLGRRTFYSYDEAYNLTSVTDPAGREETITYDELNRAATITDANGGLWRSEFDALGYITRQVDPRGAENRFEYSASQLNRMTNALGQVVEYSYDLQGNVTSFKDERGFVTNYEYDSRNRLIAQTDPTGARDQWSYDDFGSVIEYIDPMGATATNQYDEMHRLVKAIGLSGGETTYTYDDVGNVTSVTDPLGRVVSREYDDRNRLTRTIDARAGATSYVYDEVDNVLSLTDPLGNRTQWEYDALDRVAKTIDPLGALSTITYDVAGNIQQTRDRLGRTRNMTYDRLDRLTQEVWKDPIGAIVDTHTYSYDPTGDMLTAQDGDSKLTFTYDLLGQLTSADNVGTSGIPRVRLSYGYDAAGNRVRVSDNFNVTVDSTYDSRNMLSERAWTGLGAGGSVSARVGMSYNARGQFTEINRFNSLTAPTPGSTERMSYDASGRITQMRNTSATDAVLANYDMAWDLADQLIEWNINGLTQRYNYDLTGQLTSVTRGDTAGAESYQYDLNGNRQGTGQTIGANNRLMSDDKFDYQYDAEGNRTAQIERATGRVTSFTYDHENHLLTATTRSPAGTLLSNVRYRYDALGRRNARIADSDGSGPVAGTIEYYVYDGEAVWLDASASGEITARYLQADGIDSLLARYRTSDGLTWYITDHLGSVRALVDTAGNVISQVDYDSFGNILATTGNATSLDRYLYTGREFDPIINQYHYRTRQYDPRAGVFTTEDTIGFWGGDTNLSRYAGNSGTYARDPFGTTTTTEMFFAVRYGEQIGRGAAGAEIGFALGYICGFVEAWYENQGRDWGDRFNAAFQAAQDSANEGASIGMLMGILGASAAAPVRWAVNTYGVLTGIEAVLASPDNTVLAIRSLCVVAGVGLGIQASQKLSPGKFRIRSIAEHPALHRLWQQSIQELYHGKGPIGGPLRRYLNTIASGKIPSGKVARAAYKSVQGAFIRRLEKAMNDGQKFPGWSFEELHHWNWAMSSHSLHAIDPRHIYPMSKSLHKAIHTRTTAGPITQPLDIYIQPINPRYILILDHAFPLAPM